MEGIFHGGILKWFTTVRSSNRCVSSNLSTSAKYYETVYLVFRKLRKFPSNILPLSTAVYKPKWYDGLSIRELSPYKIKEVECIDCDHSHHETCSFLKQYREYLETLDFDEVYHKLNAVSELTNMDVCLLVYEVTSNPCSERGPLVDWFKKHGVEITEFGAAAKSWGKILRTMGDLKRHADVAQWQSSWLQISRLWVRLPPSVSYIL